MPLVVILLVATVSAIALVASGVSNAFPAPGANERVSAPPAGTDLEFLAPAMSHDGRFVAYLGGAVDHPTTLLFVRDRTLARTDAVALAPPAGAGGGFSAVRISDDGRYLAVQESNGVFDSVVYVDRGAPNAVGVFTAAITTTTVPTPIECARAVITGVAPPDQAKGSLGPGNPTEDTYFGTPSTVLVVPQATFSAPVLPDSLAMTLVGSAGNPVAGTVSLDGANLHATFTPAAALGLDTYTATATASTTDGGATNASWKFIVVPGLVAPRRGAAVTPFAVIIHNLSTGLVGMSSDGSQVLVTTRYNNIPPVCTAVTAWVWSRGAAAPFNVNQVVPGLALTHSSAAAISADGSHIALIGKIANGPSQMFVYDRDVDGNGIFDEPGADHRAAAPVAITPAPDNPSEVALSGNGSVLAFTAGNSDHVPQIFADDFNPPAMPAPQLHAPLGTGRVAQVTQGDSGSYAPSLSLDGRYIAFVSTASNLVPGVTLNSDGGCNDGTAQCNVIEADRIGIGGVPQFDLVSNGVRGATVPLADGDSQAGNGGPPISGDGRLVAFESDADNLIATGVECDLNNCDPAKTDADSDVFVHTSLPGLVGTPNPRLLDQVKIGKTSPARVVTFTHTDFGAIRPTSIAITGADKDEFVVKPGQTCVGSILHARDTCVVPVAFVSKRPGGATALLELRHNGRGGVSTVRLVSTGVALTTNFIVSPPILDFGTQVLAVPTATPKVVTITNIGEARLVVDPVVINGEPRFDYLTTTNCPAALPLVLSPGQSCTVSVRFRPTSIEERDAALLISAHPPGSKKVETAMIALKGNAPMPSIELSPEVAHPRSVVQVIAKNWPPNSTIVMNWAGLPGIRPSTIIVPATATVPNVQQLTPSDVVLVYPRADVGTRTLRATSTNPFVNMTPPHVPALFKVLDPIPTLSPGDVAAVPLNFLVQAPTVNGQLDFTIRNG